MSITKQNKSALEDRNALIKEKTKAFSKSIQRLPGISNQEKMKNLAEVGIADLAMHMMGNGWSVLLGQPLETFVTMKDNIQGGYDAAFKEYIELVRLMEPFTDIFGPLQVELTFDSHAKLQGQFFTPPLLASGASRFIKTVDRYDFGYAIADPMCGYGELIMACLRGMSDEAMKGAFFCENDKDPLCAKITALQLMANQVVHKRVVGSLEVQCRDIIAEYCFYKPLVVCTHVDYQLRMQEAIGQMRQGSTRLLEAS